MNKIPIKYEEKPSEDLILQFEKRIDYYLSGIGAKTKVVLYEHPFDIHSSVNGVEMDIERHWISHFLVSTPEIKDFEVRTFEPGIGSNWRETAWYEAHEIQGRLYRHLKRNPGSPQDGDPYWQLWEKLKEDEGRRN